MQLPHRSTPSQVFYPTRTPRELGGGDWEGPHGHEDGAPLRVVIAHRYEKALRRQLEDATLSLRQTVRPLPIGEALCASGVSELAPPAPNYFFLENCDRIADAKRSNR